jgi:hypothetical protein
VGFGKKWCQSKTQAGKYGKGIFLFAAAQRWYFEVAKLGEPTGILCNSNHWVLRFPQSVAASRSTFSFSAFL